MILESLVTTRNEPSSSSHPEQSVNLSPMGPRLLSRHADGELATFELRPFDTSRTFSNLRRTKQGVMHVDDNVLLFAQSAVGQLLELPELYPATKVAGDIIVSSCRAYEFEVKFIDSTGPRMSLNCEVVAVHRHRDFFGFNRAKHAVLEAAILATRIDFLPREEIQSSFKRLALIVQKTSGPDEEKAFQVVQQYAESAWEKSVEH